MSGNPEILPDLIIEIFRAIIVGMIVLFLLFNQNTKELKKVKGWNFFIAGFCLVFFGTAIDITDNFDSLNRFIIIGDTEPQAFLEKIIGYLLGAIFIAIGTWSWIPEIIKSQNEKERELEKATQKIKILSGLLPICANCKRVRDDKGSWKPIESYIRDHSEAEFSHSICPDCSKKLYPEFAKELHDQ